MATKQVALRIDDSDLETANAVRDRIRASLDIPVETATVLRMAIRRGLRSAASQLELADAIESLTAELASSETEQTEQPPRRGDDGGDEEFRFRSGSGDEVVERTRRVDGFDVNTITSSPGNRQRTGSVWVRVFGRGPRGATPIVPPSVLTAVEEMVRESHDGEQITEEGTANG